MFHYLAPATDRFAADDPQLVVDLYNLDLISFAEIVPMSQLRRNRDLPLAVDPHDPCDSECDTYYTMYVIPLYRDRRAAQDPGVRPGV